MPDTDRDEYENIDPRAVKALGTFDWLRILPCGHPGQKFKGLYAQPPCATCYDGGPSWRGLVVTNRMAGALTGTGYTEVSADTRTQALDVRAFIRASVTCLNKGRRAETWVWWPVYGESGE